MKLLNEVKKFKFRNLFLSLKFSYDFNSESIEKLLSNYAIIQKIIFYDAKIDSFTIFESTVASIVFTTKSINYNDGCGVVNKNHFVLNMMHFTESIKHNTCLNRKICFDSEGYIKNCPSMLRNFGNINEISLEEVIELPEFKYCWFINKDKIDVCQDCEFRHICTDCRAFIKNDQNIYSCPDKCHYNPYIAKWKDEDEYIDVENWRKENPEWNKKCKRILIKW
jgi:SPASM domain peptide maturase of grasp-with-spasm system